MILSYHDTYTDFFMYPNIELPANCMNALNIVVQGKLNTSSNLWCWPAITGHFQSVYFSSEPTIHLNGLA